MYKMAKKSIFDNLKSTAGHIDKSLHKAHRAKRQGMRLKRQVASGKVAKAEKTAAKVYRSSKQSAKQDTMAVGLHAKHKKESLLSVNLSNKKSI